jgi:tRNA dimethylallyltransferase
MDIGTEKPSRDVMTRIPHHLIDIVEPWEEYNTGRYVRDFEATAQALSKKGRPFIVVGGTALYLKAIMDGLFEGPSADWEYRNYLKSIAMEQSPDYLYEMLADADPETAGKLHRNDQKRIIRALEVIKKTGRPLSSLQTQFGFKNAQYDCTVVVINYERNVLYKRIESRVDKMFMRGLIGEVKSLVDNPRGLSKQASQALGYKEVIDFFSGKYTLSETTDIIKKRTRRFAKRQMTWFRSFPHVNWVHVSETDSIKHISENVLKHFIHDKKRG